MIDLYDSEIITIETVWATLKQRSAGRRNFQDFENEIKERFAEAGFVASVNWYTGRAPDGTEISGMYMPEISIDGRIATDGSTLQSGQFTFDHDRQVHEVTNDLLELGEGGVIKTGSLDAAQKEIINAHKHGC